MKHLTLIDGNSILFRAYYATAYPGREVMHTSTGIYTNAIFAFVNMLERLKDLSNDHILVCFDTGEPTFRHEQFDGYKANRSSAPDELISQFPLVRQLLDKQGIKRYEQSGLEADDVIGIMAKKAASEGIKVDIYSSDRDLLQLVDENITVNLLKSGMKEVIAFTPETVFENYGLNPRQFIDLKALMGDPSDNIPGIKGIGEKTGIKLLQEYGNLDAVLANASKQSPALAQKLIDGKDAAYLSKELATINTTANINLTLDDTLVKDIDKYELLDFYKMLELRQIAINYARKHNLNPNMQSSTPTNVTKDEAPNTFIFIDKIAQLDEILNQSLSVFFEFDVLNYHHAQIWGIGLASATNSYFIEPELAFKSDKFLAYLASKKYIKYFYDYKALKVNMLWQGHDVNGCGFDLLLGNYILDSSSAKDDFFHQVSLHQIDIAYDEQIYGKGAKRAKPLLVEDYAAHIAKKARIIYQLKDKVTSLLKDANQLSLLNDVEIPLADVLARMEFLGLKVDKAELDKQTSNLVRRIKNLEDEIHLIAGYNFNIASPKQLADVLIDLGLGHFLAKKTKTGVSVDIDVLNLLKTHHEIIAPIIEYRRLSKLYSTYLVGIKEQMFKDGCVHTIYKQALTATGRLSSIEPNLQNIPIRTQEGAIVRKIFIPKDGFKFLAADYSQIELRVLAHIADETNLIEAFLNNEDIHETTAKKVFDVSYVNSEYRRRAKAVNFGIIYGIGAFSLGNDLGIPYGQAQHFIDTYLQVYPKIAQYMAKSRQDTLNDGYVSTILNRKRFIPEITSTNKNIREFGYRTALNAPIQGSAADIIKLAMINLDMYLKENNFKSRLILQIHDELILEVAEDEIDEISKAVVKIMTNAYPLKVKLETSLSCGNSLFDLK